MTREIKNCGDKPTMKTFVLALALALTLASNAAAQIYVPPGQELFQQQYEQDQFYGQFERQRQEYERELQRQRNEYNRLLREQQEQNDRLRRQQERDERNR